MQKTNKYNVTGYIIIAAGILFNEFFIKSVLKWGNKFDTPVKSILLLCLELIIILTGIYIIRKKKQAVTNLSVFILSLVVFLLALELLLSLKAFESLSSQSPLWIPAKYKDISTQFFRTHNDKSKLNKYGFNDVNHTRVKKDNSVLRIAVLGDSFIWGYGAPDSVIWTHKLENRFRSNGINCEVLNWGKNGWSTLDEYNFLINNDSIYQFDYLIFAFVVNDPVFDSLPIKQIINQDGFFGRRILNPISAVLPNDISFFSDLINNFSAKYFNFGYMKWLQRIYTENNLLRYSNLIKDIKQHCDSKKIRFSFVLTPENHDVQLKTYFDKIIPILKKNNVPYLDLFPYVSNDLRGYPNRALWANPSDGHPGSLVTEVYSRSVFEYLKTNFLIPPAIK
jgi:lysophospholipase L1-like esterase